MYAGSWDSGPGEAGLSEAAIGGADRMEGGSIDGKVA